MVCRYCGLDAGGGVGHSKIIDCVHALRQESVRLQRRAENVASLVKAKGGWLADRGPAIQMTTTRKSTP